MAKVFGVHSDLLLADCTYKTNRYRMPLLYFVGLTAIGTHFTAAFCFMPGESQAEYTWAMRQFVDLVLGTAQIHVFLSDNKSALKNAVTEVELKAQQRNKFMESWYRLCKAKTPDQYEDMYTALKHDYRTYPTLIQYLEDHQYPQRKAVAFAWTSRVRHYGNTATSRLEQAH